jgi:Fe(3+) dicitrate transport protein
MRMRLIYIKRDMRLLSRKTMIPSPLAQMLIAGLAPCLPGLVAAEATTPSASAPKPSDKPQNLAALVVSGETIKDQKIQNPFLAEVVGMNIYAGKKTSVMDFDSLPQINTDNYRQAFAKTPGLLTSEVSNNSLLSLNYRGVGDPHESQNLMVLKNGIPFVLDPLGYSTVYFAPPFESVDRLEFVSGGAALLFGAQPSGALNYITHQPDRSKPFQGSTQHIVGSDNLYSTFTTLEGGDAKFGYILNYDHRSGDSFRTNNSDFELNGIDLSMVYDIDEKQRLSASFELYEADHGEPGGRNAANYVTAPNQNLLNHDRIRLDRTFVSLGYELGNEDAKWKTQVWASDVVRYSKRQTGVGFGVINPTGNNRLDINQHTYYTLGLDSRFLLNYNLGQEQSTFTLGLTAMEINSPIFTERTNAGDLTSDRGPNLRFDAERDSRIVALFAENLFRYERFTFTPSMRLEYNAQGMDERINVAKSNPTAPTPVVPLIDETRSEFVPLGGLAATFDATATTEIYANVSSAYKPPTYGDAFPVGSATTYSDNLDAGQVINSEIGYRGNPTLWSSFDASLFHIDYDNRFGSVTSAGISNFQNVGRSVNQGFSLSGEIDFHDLVNGESSFDISWYTAYQYLNADFKEGAQVGKTPQYAPEHMIRTGLIVQQQQEWKAALMFTHLSQHWADDNNTANFKIPAYAVLDLTAESKIWSSTIGTVDTELWAICGINNLLDEGYYSRVRGNGIDPANGRNYYVGLRAKF